MSGSSLSRNMPPDLAVLAHGAPVEQGVEGLADLHLCRLKVFGLPGQPDPGFELSRSFDRPEPGGAARGALHLHDPPDR